MNKALDQFTSAIKSNSESMFAVSNAWLSCFERLSVLNMGLARTVLEGSAAAWKNAVDAKDARALAGMASDPQPTIARGVMYSREVYAILSETGATVVKEVERQTLEWQKGVSASLDKAIAVAPQNSQAGLATLKAAVVNATAAYDSMAKAARHVTDSAQAHFSAAADASLKAAGHLAPASHSERNKVG